MNALLNVFARLCVFRRGPEDMPYAPPLVGILLALWMVIQLLSAALDTMPWQPVSDAPGRLKCAPIQAGGPQWRAKTLSTLSPVVSPP